MTRRRSDTGAWAAIPVWVLCNQDLSAVAIRVYGILSFRSDQDGVCWPGREWIAEQVGKSADTVDRALRDLVVAEALDVVPTYLDDAGERTYEPTNKRTSNEYVVYRSTPEGRAPSRKDAATPSRKDAATPGRVDAAPPGRNGAAVSRSSSNQIQIDLDLPIPPGSPALELVPPPLAASAADSDFARFWQVYPAKRKRLEALRAWPKAVKAVGGDVQRLVDGAQRYRDDPNRSPGYTCNPASWLNAGSWDDEPLPSKLANGTNGSRPIHRPLDTDRTGPSGRTIL